jgi:hopanoid-associated phosphorylase
VRAFVLAACGLALEARIAAGRDVIAVAGGVDANRLATDLEREVARGAKAIISFGIAGALAPQLAAGEFIVARGVVMPGSFRRCDDRWSARLCARLPGARYGDLACSDAPLAHADAKRALYKSTLALAVDTESHVAADVAREHGLSFAAVRVIADAAERDLPPAAAVALKPGGRVDIAAVLRSLVADPSQLALLMRTAIDARIAVAALRRGRRRLGDDLCAFGRNVL